MAAKHQKYHVSQPPVRIRVRTVLPLVVLLVALYVLVPRFSSFSTSWAVLRTADIGLSTIAVVAVAGTNVAGALVYWRLVTRPVAFMPLVLVQVAGSFTNRLLPAGVGAMATGAAYLMKQGHTAAQAGSIAVLNNILGFVGNIALLGIIVLLSPAPLGVRVPTVPLWAWLSLLAVVACALVVALWWPRARNTIQGSMRELRRIVRRPARLVSALACSMLLTSCFVLALYMSAHAVAVPLTLLQAFYVLTAGVAAGAITPVPGGLGGAEAGMVAALVSVGITPAPALAVALLFRMASYWLPILPGFICFQIALKKHFI